MVEAEGVVAAVIRQRRSSVERLVGYRIRMQPAAGLRRAMMALHRQQERVEMPVTQQEAVMVAAAVERQLQLQRMELPAARAGVMAVAAGVAERV